MYVGILSMYSDTYNNITSLSQWRKQAVYFGTDACPVGLNCVAVLGLLVIAQYWTNFVNICKTWR